MIQASTQTGHKLDKQDMAPNAREAMRAWYGTLIGHMGHELDEIQWEHITGGFGTPISLDNSRFFVKYVKVLTKNKGCHILNNK